MKITVVVVVVVLSRNCSNSLVMGKIVIEVEIVVVAVNKINLKPLND